MIRFVKNTVTFGQSDLGKQCRPISDWSDQGLHWYSVADPDPGTGMVIPGTGIQGRGHGTRGGRGQGTEGQGHMRKVQGKLLH